MAKAKEYIGESYTDSLGQQWRWDGKTYVRNFGASPMASIKRSWDQKIVPLAEQAGQALTNKGPIEGRSRKRSPKDEAINWFNAVIEDPSLSDQVRTSLVQANLGMQNAFELEDTDTMTWAQSIAMQDGNQDLTENISEVEKENKKTEVDTDSGIQPNQYRESTFEQGKETTSKIGKIGDKDWTKDQKYDRTDPTQRRDRRLQDKLVEGRPLDKFKLNVERGNTGTPVSELFHKDKLRRR